MDQKGIQLQKYGGLTHLFYVFGFNFNPMVVNLNPLGDTWSFILSLIFQVDYMHANSKLTKTSIIIKKKRFIADQS